MAAGGSGRGKKKCKVGGQKGHKKYECELFKLDEVDGCWQYTLEDEDGLEPIAQDDPGEEAWRIVVQHRLDRPESEDYRAPGLPLPLCLHRPHHCFRLA
ncbi:MAG: hypothetical protein AAGC44_06750 [Planctomycetota bacterium]